MEVNFLSLTNAFHRRRSVLALPCFRVFRAFRGRNWCSEDIAPTIVVHSTFSFLSHNIAKARRSWMCRQM